MGRSPLVSLEPVRYSKTVKDRPDNAWKQASDIETNVNMFGTSVQNNSLSSVKNGHLIKGDLKAFELCPRP